jgi:hypothetical protein
MRRLLPSRPGAAFVASALLGTAAAILSVAGLDGQLRADGSKLSEKKTYLGFDRNEYPGDAALPVLRQTFSFSGYWLNTPPGAKDNSWTGKREAVKKAGLGFLLLFNGRLDTEIKKTASPTELGRSDAQAAVATARSEGFPIGSLIFLDQEEGGRMLPEQKAYIYAWVDGVNDAGYRAGIYCSGVAAAEGNVFVVTASDIQENSNGRKIEFWVSNDSCPPSPGCSYSRPPRPSASGIRFASVWQYAQSPRRRDFARSCSNYIADGNCYPPKLLGERIFVDLDSAGSPDPSRGR